MFLVSMFLSSSFAGKTARETRSAWAAVWIILLGLAMAAGGAYLVYKYRLRVSLCTILCQQNLDPCIN